MQVRRIDPANGFSDHIANLEDRIRRQETKPTGTVVVRETLSTTDPVTGVTTTLGKLPDGSFGLQQWINDTTPPNQPSTPTVSSSLGLINVQWDGLDTSGGAPPVDYDRTIIEMSPDGSTGWVKVDELRGKGVAYYSGLTGGTVRYVRLVSLDHNQNRSTPSASVSVTVVAAADEATIAAKISSVNQTATAAQATANSKNQAYYQPTQPSGGTYSKGDLWFDTSNGYKLYTYSGTAWQATQDSATALSTANGKNSVFTQNTAPTAKAVGDIWIDTGNGNVIKTWSGSAWVNSQDAAIGTANTNANNALTVANGRNTTFIATTAPTANAVGDLWVDSANGNRLNRWSGTAWVNIQDAAIATAQSAANSAQTSANGKNKVTYSTSAASGSGVTAGDTWYQTDVSGNVIAMWSWSGSAWVSQTIANQVISSLDAGKLTAGYLAAARIQAGTITASMLAADTITAAQIAASAITASELAAGSVTASAISAGAVDATKLSANSITATALAAGSVQATAIAANAIAVGTAVIQNGAITNAMIADATIQSAKIGSVDAGTVTAGTLSAARIGAKTITTDKLVISSTDNLISEPNFGASGVSWVLGSGLTIDPTGSRSGTTALKIANAASKQGSYNLPNDLVTNAGSAYRMVAWIKSDTAIPASGVNLYVKVKSTSGTYTESITATSPASASATWVQLSGAYVVPAGTASISFGVFSESSFSTGNVWIDSMFASRMSNGELVVDGTITSTSIASSAILTNHLQAGSVTASKLEAQLVLASEIVAGPINDTHASMKADGFRVYKKDPVSGVVSEAIRLGVASSDDYFAVQKSDGTYAATISQTGTVSASAGTFNSSLTYKGYEMSNLLDKRALGVVAWGQFNGNQLPNVVNGQERGLFELAFIPDPSRMYKVTCSPVLYTPNGGTATAAALKLRYTSDGTQPTTTSTLLAEDYHPVLVNGAWTTSYMISGRLFGGFNGSYIRLLFSMAASNGNGINAEAGQSPTFFVEDVGPLYSSSGVLSSQVSGGGTPSPVVATYEKTYSKVDQRSYTLSNGQVYNYDTGRAYEGLSPASAGALGSMLFFPDMTTDLTSGCTIMDMQLYLYWDHWYYNAGGNASIGVHTATGSPPSTFSSYADMYADSPGWPNPGGVWVPIPSNQWASFKAGAATIYRGITLGKSSYADYQHYGICSDAKIYVKYSK